MSTPTENPSTTTKANGQADSSSSERVNEYHGIGTGFDDDDDDFDQAHATELALSARDECIAISTRMQALEQTYREHVTFLTAQASKVATAAKGSRTADISWAVSLLLIATGTAFYYTWPMGLIVAGVFVGFPSFYSPIVREIKRGPSN